MRLEQELKESRLPLVGMGGGSGSAGQDGSSTGRAAAGELTEELVQDLLGKIGELAGPAPTNEVYRVPSDENADTAKLDRRWRFYSSLQQQV